MESVSWTALLVVKRVSHRSNQLGTPARKTRTWTVGISREKFRVMIVCVNRRIQKKIRWKQDLNLRGETPSDMFGNSNHSP